MKRQHQDEACGPGEPCPTCHPRDWDKDDGVFAGLSEPVVRPENRSKKEINWFKVWNDARQQYDRICVLWQEGKADIAKKQAAHGLFELATEQWLRPFIVRVLDEERDRRMQEVPSE